MRYRRGASTTSGVAVPWPRACLRLHVSLHSLALFDSLVPTRHTTYTVALPHFGMLCWYCSTDTICTAPTVLVTSH